MVLLNKDGKFEAWDWAGRKRYNRKDRYGLPGCAGCGRDGDGRLEIVLSMFNLENEGRGCYVYGRYGR